MATCAPRTSSSSDETTVFPTVDQFANALSSESHWYNLGIFLQVPTHEMDTIGLNYRSEGTLRCLIEIYKSLELRRRVPSWELLSQVLGKINNDSLASEIYRNYVMKRQKAPPLSSEESSKSSSISDKNDLIVESVDVSRKVTREFQKLTEKFSLLVTDITNAFKSSSISVNDLQQCLLSQYEIAPLLSTNATIDNIFLQLHPYYCLLNYHILKFLTKQFLNDNASLKRRLAEYKTRINAFENSTKMRKLMRLLKRKRQVTPSGSKVVKLKVREYWNDVTLDKFRRVIRRIMSKVYRHGAHIEIDKGSLAISWIVPDKLVNKLDIPIQDVVFQIIGVLSLHIDDEPVYDFPGGGCETIEAAMLQAIELKNTRAIELLLVMGCNPEVATYNGDNAVTTIVNIRESKKSSVDHVCIIGHNEHVEATVDPSSEPVECSSCNMKEKIIKRLHQQMDTLRQEQTTLHLLTDQLQLTVKAKEIEVEVVTEQMKDKATKYESLMNELFRLKEEMKIKDADNTLLKKDVEILIKEKQSLITGKPVDNESKPEMEQELIESCNSTAELPRQQLGIGAEMRVKIITRDSNGKELDNGGSAVRAVLSCNEEECSVTNNDDGTCYVTVIPQQLGQHQLSITIDNQHIQNSPFSLTIVPQRDYTKLKQPAQTIKDIRYPRSIAFSNNGDKFVTSSVDHCIHVYDKSGNKKTTIGSEGSGELQFNNPRGIDTNGDIVYVTESGGNKIHKLTTRGEFIGTFGEKGSGIGQFDYPYDVKISPDGKIYVADTSNDRVQVFHPDWTISHVIDGRVSGDGNFIDPKEIVFDLLGNVHVTNSSSIRVVVFTPSGQFVRQYADGQQHMLIDARGIAIDSSGYSLVTGYSDDTLSVFNPNGILVHSVGGLNRPRGVSVSPTDQSFWVADSYSHKLVKY